MAGAGRHPPHRADRRRDTVAALSPPALDGDDLAVCWQQLTDWATRTSAALGVEIAQARDDSAAADAAADERTGGIEALLRGHDLDPAGLAPARTAPPRPPA